LLLACATASGQYSGQRKSAPPPHSAQSPKPKPATRPTGVKVYENPENQFSIRAPAAWTEAGGGSGANNNGTLYSFAIVVPDGSNATLPVRVPQPEVPSADLDAAVEALKKKSAETKDSKIRDTQKTKLGGEDARVITIDNYPGANAIQRTTLAMHNGRLVLLVLDAPDAKSYQKTMALSDSVVRSLHWLDKKPATQPAPASLPAPTASN